MRRPQRLYFDKEDGKYMKMENTDISHDTGRASDLNQLPSAYRRAMCVKERMVFSYIGGKTTYYVCPRCKTTLEREFMSFCDRCGQKLDWRGYQNVRVEYPQTRIGL